MARQTFVLVSALFWCGSAAAQDDLLKDFTTGHLERFLQEDLGKTFTRQKNRYDIQGTPYYAMLSGKVLFFYAQFPLERLQLPITAKTVNDWNAAAFHTRAYFTDSRQAVVRLEGSLDLSAGITRGQLRAFYDRVDAEIARLSAKHFGGPRQDPPPVDPGPAADVVRQHFPAAAEPADRKTAWEIEWDLVPSPYKAVHLLRIVAARFHFKDAAGQDRSVVVARNLVLAEAFAPYDNKTTAFLDLALKNRANRTVLASEALKGPNCVAPGEILKWSRDPHFTIYREVHDDGIRWLDGYGKPGFGENPGYRGEKLVLTSTWQAVNYVYLNAYDFTDDGRIVCRLGFTGHNFYDRGKGSRKLADGDVHLHVGCWRMEFDLGDPRNNDYLLVRRYFDAAEGRHRVGALPFNGGREGKARWEPAEFTTLRVVSGAEKSLAGKRPISYDLIPSRQGSVRDLPPYADVRDADMDFVNYDFWLTRPPATAGYYPYHQVPDLARGRRPLKGQPVTVWYNTPAIHVPRGEDFGPDGQNQRKGVALTTWVEFTLRPRDLFDATPLYPQKK